MPDVEVVSLFTELAALPSPPGEERVVADRVAAYMRDLGLEVAEDDAGPRIGSDAGNLYARIEPTAESGTPLFFCAHLDTVPPEGAIEPVVEDGVVRNAGGTVEKVDVWGRRRLSYEINKSFEGIYAILDLHTDPDAVVELDRQLNLNESVLRTKVIRLPDRLRNRGSASRSRTGSAPATAMSYAASR